MTSRYSPYKPIMRQVFNSESDVIANGGTSTDVVYDKGVGQFNGTSSYIKYNLALKGTYSIRYKLKTFTSSSSCTFLDFRNSCGTGTGYLTGGTGSVGQSSGTSYINGIATNVYVSGQKIDIVITGMTINCIELFVNTRYTLANWLNSEIELIEIYSGTLTAQEVKNLYENKWNTEFVSKDKLCDVNAFNGVLKDRTDLTLTPSNVELKKIGNYYSPSFKTLGNEIDTGANMLGAKAVTICAWIKPDSVGQNAGRIVDNTSSGFFVSTANIRNIGYYGPNSVYSATVSIDWGKWHFVSMTRTTGSIVNFYIGDLDNAPALSGTANQNAGTLTDAGANTIIGNRNAADRSFDGLIPFVQAYSGVLSLEDITQVWSSTRGLVR
jgi:hypothetical protein